MEPEKPKSLGNHSKGIVDKPEETLSFEAVNPSDKSGDTKVNVKLVPSKWKLKFYERSKNRMKITIKLSSEDAQAWQNFSHIMRDEKLSEDEFVKAVFLTGIETLNNRLAERIKDMMIENEEGLEKPELEISVGDEPIIETFDEGTSDGEETKE